MLVPDFLPTKWATAERSFQLGILLSSFTWAPSFTITFLFGGCKDIQVASNRTSTNTSAPNKRNRSESRTTCGGQKKMLLDRFISRRFLHYVRTADLWNMYLTPCYHSNPMGLIKSVSCRGLIGLISGSSEKWFCFFVVVVVVVLLVVVGVVFSPFWFSWCSWKSGGHAKSWRTWHQILR